jgi:hypothetical protein
LDHLSPYHDITGIVYESDNFYKVSHSIIGGCWRRALIGDRITMDDLFQYLLDVEEYALSRLTKKRKPRGLGMEEDCETYGYGTSTKAVLFSALYDNNSPVRNDESREGRRFQLYYGVPWKVFVTLVKKFGQRFNPRALLRKQKDIPFKLCSMACLRHLRIGGPLGQHLSTY